MGHGFKVEFKSGQNANLEQAETGPRLSCSPPPKLISLCSTYLSRKTEEEENF